MWLSDLEIGRLNALGLRDRVSLKGPKTIVIVMGGGVWTFGFLGG